MNAWAVHHSCFRCATVLEGCPERLELAARFCLHRDSIVRCYVLLRVLPGGSPQLRFYVHLNVNRAMTHAAELFFFFFNATSCPEPRRKEEDICFLESRAGVKHPSCSPGARLSAAVMTQPVQQKERCLQEGNRPPIWGRTCKG